MPRPSQLSPITYCVFYKLGVKPRLAEIAQGLHLKKADTRPLFKMLSKLKKRRAIEELPEAGTGCPIARRSGKKLAARRGGSLCRASRGRRCRRSRLTMR